VKVFTLGHDDQQGKGVVYRGRDIQKGESKGSKRGLLREGKEREWTCV
jgi:hypothetical protein